MAHQKKGVSIMAHKRRGRGEGSIYYDEARQLWVSQVSLGRDPVSGKRRRETVYGQTKQEVQAKLLDLQQKAADGRLDHGDMVAKNFLEFWLGHIKPNVAAATYRRYEVLVHQHLVPYLGNRKLADLSAFDVARLYEQMQAAGVPGPTRHLAAIRLRQALRYAVRFGLLHSSPADRVDVPRLDSSEVRPLDAGQVAAFLAAAAGHRLYALFVLALDSGARIGELTALTWDDLDWARAELSITKSLEQKGKDRQAKAPKTAAGRRRITLTPTTMIVLREHRERMQAEGHGGPIMFPTLTGKPYRQGNITEDHFAPLLRRAGLPHFRFHDLRHTCATLLLQAGVNIKVISERLGHASVSITLETYSHVMPTMQAQAADKMEGILVAALSAPAAAAPAATQATAEIGSSMAANQGDAA
jgi:integrase